MKLKFLVLQYNPNISVILEAELIPFHVIEVETPDALVVEPDELAELEPLPSKSSDRPDYVGTLLRSIIAGGPHSKKN